MHNEPDAIEIRMLHPLALFLDGAERREIALEAFLQLYMPDDLDMREIGIARDVIAMRLRVDEIADRRLLLHALAPAHRIHRDLRRIDHDEAVRGLDEARIAAGEIDFRKAV